MCVCVCVFSDLDACFLGRAVCSWFPSVYVTDGNWYRNVHSSEKEMVWRS